ncbi:MAG: type II toxin-antitoxin system VapC family toxin [Phycisphaerales bacterium]
MSPTVYIETSVVSYLTSRPSRDVVVAAHQRLTSRWWTNARPSFNPVVSQLVIDEASLGDPASARRRTHAISGLPILELTHVGRELARALLDEVAMPPTAIADALHIAIAAENGAHYLLTWNCRHIATASSRALIERTLRLRGYDAPVLCTPEELMEP